ncbi:MAG: glycosyltransferase [Candidatus Magasanikbacteria bacterium]|nr:glycosyltransferase [Candidatus Magasanikbacteria bacterium]
MIKKILIISAKAGAGHIRAAEALTKTALLQFPELEVKHIEFTDFIPSVLKTVFFDSYGPLVCKAPIIWDFLFKKTNTELGSATILKLISFLQKTRGSSFVKAVLDFNPDLILHTHFVSPYISSESKQLAHIPNAIVITDYGVHKLWVGLPQADYFMPHQDMIRELNLQRIPLSRIHVTGMSIDPVFYKHKESGQLKQKYGFELGKPLILVLAGGQGLSDTTKPVKAISSIQTPFTLVAIAGKNKTLEKKLKNLKLPKQINYRTTGWTDTIDEYIRMADCVVGKPGGMTTSECMALGKPIIAINAVPGQEELNADFIIKHRLGLIAKSMSELPGLVLDVIQKKQAFKPICYPRSAEEILKICVSKM